jgi:hypothetical protein
MEWNIEVSQVVGPIILIFVAYKFSVLLYRTYMITFFYRGEDKRALVINGLILMAFCTITIGASVIGAYKFAQGSKYDNPVRRVQQSQ